MLIGIVVTNAIVLVDLVNQYRRRGLSVLDALLQARPAAFADPDDGARHHLRAACRWRLGSPARADSSPSRSLSWSSAGWCRRRSSPWLCCPCLYLLVEGARERRAIRKEERGARQHPPSLPLTSSPQPDRE
jgi:HAE1 family hydrophobic/amphiphilic exporter-1